MSSLSSNTRQALTTFPQGLRVYLYAEENSKKQLKETRTTRGQEPTLPSYLPNSGFDELLS